MPRIPIRVKLAVALAVPLLGLLVFSAVEVRQVALDAAEVRSEAGLASAVTGPAGVITRLQDERSWAVIELTGLESTYQVPVPGYDETRAASDDAIRAFRSDVASKGGAVEATYRDALDALDAVESIRRDIDRTSGPRSLRNMAMSTQIYDSYAELIDGLLQANSRVTLQVHDTELRQGTRLADLASRQLELQADVLRQTAVDAMLSPDGIDTHAEITRIATSLSAFDANNQQFQGATGRYAGIVRDLYPRDLADSTHQYVRAAIDQGTIDSLQAFLDRTTPAPDGGYFALRDAFVDAVGQRADMLDARAIARRRQFTFLAGGAFVLAATMTWLVSRSITRPLRSLTRQAKEMAQSRLPRTVRAILDIPPGGDVQVPDTVPVRVTTRDEVADVTLALNMVQESALDLAVEQALLRRNIADSILNLGRRNQNLLGRQLDFITELESHETEPDTLASLFRLDHLATRMRRNAESLLVLAGIDPPRTWAVPVRLTDVIRAALGEVEDYQRIRVADVGPATVVGTTATDLAHLLAELLENALTFSPPEADVVVRGWWCDLGTFRVAVIDHGPGMSPSAIEQANRRLRGSESFTVAPSRYLGHYVAGHLAARHGIRIQLDATPPGGILTTVDLPSTLVTPDTPPTDPGVPRDQPAAALAPQPVPRALARSAADAAQVAAPPAAAATRPGPPTTARPGPVAPGRDVSATLAFPGPSLPRRERGAQMPTLQPVSLRRPGGYSPVQRGIDGRAGTGAADDVYAYLSGFTQGVQRGLDETRHRTEQ